MPKAANHFQDLTAISKASITMALGQMVDPDLEHIVQAEGFGDDETMAGYFDRAEGWADEEWARAQRFLAPHAIDYASTLDLACGHGRHSQKLATLAKHMVLVEVNPEYMAFCRERFAGKPWDFVVNNGYDLAAVGDRSISFLYCYDSATCMFDLEIILAYIKEFRRVLVPGGFAFVHHSNVDDYPGRDFRLHPHWRNFMSKEIFAHLAIHNGLELVDQLVFDGCGPEAESDCYSLVRLDGSAFAANGETNSQNTSDRNVHNTHLIKKRSKLQSYKEGVKAIGYIVLPYNKRRREKRKKLLAGLR
jgi:SAM-dependent methyltransferase